MRYVACIENSKKGNTMIKNYLKIALRNVKKHKGYSFINIAGLVVGMLCCILILLWVQDELSYDRYHKNADRIYRITYAEVIGDAFDHYALSPFGGTQAIAAEVAGISTYTRLMERTGLIKYAENKFDERNIFYVDKDFFQIFSFELIEGDPTTALEDPGSIVLTQEMARKIFGNKPALGETLNLNADGDLQVTGVVKNVPRNSHFHFNYLVSINTIQERRARILDSWLGIAGCSYLLLEKNADAEIIEKNIAPVVDKHAGERAREVGTEMFYYLQPLTDIHLKSKLAAEIEGNGDIRYVYVFSLIAMFILLIACINFMNLSTARSAKRGKEVGLRKVLGAYKKRLVVQFLLESIGFAFVSLILALGLIWLLLPVFNDLTGKEITATSLLSLVVIIGLLFLVIITGVAAGSYPAFYLSSFQPIDTIRQKVQKGSGRSSLRNSLVILQFAISIILIISTLVVLKQLNYMKNQKLGFNKEQVLAMYIRGQGLAQQFDAFKNELKKDAEILGASYSSGIPGRTGAVLTTFLEGQPDNVSFTFDYIFSDYNFLKTYEIDLIQGRDFSRDFGEDKEGAFLINETAMSKLGWGEETVGKKIGYSRDAMRPIVGIVKDFHYKSLKHVIGPLAIYLRPGQNNVLSVKMNTDDISRTLSYIEKAWNTFEKERSFEYFFVDENFNALYHSEERLSQIITFFAFIAIFVACLGLFGLASFTAEQKTKEIGIRKVLGASVGSIVFQLSRNFVKWVLVANVIAWPLTYFVMKNYWLSNFPFRISLSFLTFALAGLMALCIALMTVGFQSIKAALADPVHSIRYE
jgi:putative ABC transport system permease protein